MSQQANSSRADIYQLLLEDSDKKKKEKSARDKERKAQLLKPLGVKEYFDEGGISIDKKTCKGVECKLCIDVCPTHALYWKAGEVGIVEDLCVYCAACVLSCVVDDCIQVWRKRPDGKVEKFSNPKDVLKLMNIISCRNRRNRVESRQRTREIIPPIKFRRIRRFF